MNSFLKDLKEALTNVGEEWKSNLKSKNKSDYKDLTVYLGPGAVKLLENNKFEWSRIHDENRVIAIKVKAVDSAIGTLYSVNNHNFNKIILLEQGLANISSLKNEVAHLTNLCVLLKDSLISLEEDLAVFEDQIEEDKFIKYQQNLKQTVTVHQSEWDLKIELLKRQLSLKQTQNTELLEKDIKKQLSERQKIFEEEYQRDLDEYLKKGRLEKHVSDPQPLNLNECENLEFEMEPKDEKELDDFLS